MNHSIDIKELDTIPANLFDIIWQILDDVSDECGEEQLADDFLLRFEGWGGNCVAESWSKIYKAQSHSGRDPESPNAAEERDNFCVEMAEHQSEFIIYNEWIPQMVKRGYGYVDGGYLEGGLFGRTWAVFKSDSLGK